MAIKFLKEWRRSIPATKPFAKMRSCVVSSKKLEEEILNYFDHERFTNATTEGRNSLIKNINGAGRGYSFENMRIKALVNPKAHKVTKSCKKAGCKGNA